MKEEIKTIKERRKEEGGGNYMTISVPQETSEQDVLLSFIMN